MDSSAKVRVSEESSGQVVWAQLDDPPGNVLDIEMIDGLRAVVADVAHMEAAKTLVFEGSGKHFSYGASIPEHAPAKVGEFLPRFHALFRELLDLALPTCAVVRGRCLGGGLELAAFCMRVFASPNAELGLPEVKLAVFPPLGSLLLPERVGRACAEDICITGRSLGAHEAYENGLVDQLHDSPADAARAWLEREILPKSAVGLRFATRAARHGLRARLIPAMDELERTYLDDLMAHEDPREGIRAFLDKRPPEWKNR